MRKSLTTGMRLSLALLWLALLALAGWAIGRHLELSGDLRKFMPARRTTRRAGWPDAAPAADQGAAIAFQS
jgi:predicted exporter